MTTLCYFCECIIAEDTARGKPVYLNCRDICNEEDAEETPDYETAGVVPPSSAKATGVQS